MSLVNLKEQDGKVIFPGYNGKFAHSQSMTVAYVSVDEGAELPEHKHPQEQIVNVVDGKFELTVEGVPHVLERGTPYVLHSNVPHAGKALTPCLILDVFSPVREDFK